MSTLFFFGKGNSQNALQGVNVYLRESEFGDFEDWANIRQRSRAFLEKWEPTWAADEFSRAAFRQRVRIYAQRARDDEGYAFFLFDKRSHALLGGLTLSHVKRGVSQSATIGYWIGEEYSGRGLMKDALKALLAVAGPRYGFHRLEAACLPQNDRSRLLLLSCGFEQEGFAKSYVKIAGRWEDHLLFGLVLG